jgi:hypothetical protein
VYKVYIWSVSGSASRFFVLESRTRNIGSYWILKVTCPNNKIVPLVSLDRFGLRPCSSFTAQEAQKLASFGVPISSREFAARITGHSARSGNPVLDSSALVTFEENFVSAGEFGREYRLPANWLAQLVDVTHRKQFVCVCVCGFAALSFL